MVRRVSTLAVAVGLAVSQVCGCAPLRQEQQAVAPVKQNLAHHSAQKDEESSPYAKVPVGYQVLDSKLTGLARVNYPTLDHDRPVVRLLPDHVMPPPPVVSKEEEDQSVDPVPPATVPVEPKIEDPLVQALRHVMDNQHDKAAEALKGLDKPNQEMVLGLLDLSARLTREPIERAKPQELAALIQQLENLTTPLRHRVPVRIDKLYFCKWIRRFGCFEPVTGVLPQFQAAGPEREGQLVQVYAEISNFITRQEGNEYVACLSSSFEVRNIDDEVVWTHQFSTEPDRSRSPRHDYFINYWFHIPAALKPGNYTLWVKVQDVLPTPKRPLVRRSLDFRVITQGSVPGPRIGPGRISKVGGGGS